MDSIQEKISCLRTDAESFAEKMNREYYLHLSGQKSTLEIIPIYVEHSELFETEIQQELTKLIVQLQKNDPSFTKEESRQLLFLWQGAILYRSFFEFGMIEEEQNNLEASLTINFKGKNIHWRDFNKTLSDLKEKQERNDLVATANQLAVQFNPLRKRMVETADQIAKKMNFNNYCDLSLQTKSINLESLKISASKILSETKNKYNELFQKYILGNSSIFNSSVLYSHDIQAHLKDKLSRIRIPANDMVQHLHRAYSSIGINTDLPNLLFDLEHRPTKTPRAYCLTPRVPEEVILIIKPSGTINDYRALFHESGHCLHYAYTDPNLPMEYRILGDNTITETWAFLSESFLNTQFVLEKILDIPNRDILEYLPLIQFDKLLAVRRMCIKIEHETEILSYGMLSEKDAKSFNHSYESHMNFSPLPWAYMFFDPALYSAQYLQAWILEAQILKYLRNEFEEWYKNPNTGAWLIHQWKKGQKPSKSDLSGYIGKKPYDHSDLVDQVTNLISQNMN